MGLLRHIYQTEFYKTLSYLNMHHKTFLSLGNIANIIFVQLPSPCLISIVTHFIAKSTALLLSVETEAQYIKTNSSWSNWTRSLIHQIDCSQTVWMGWDRTSRGFITLIYRMLCLPHWWLDRPGSLWHLPTTDQVLLSL